MKKVIFVLSALFVITGCEMLYMPSINKARQTAGAFMASYYVDMDYEKALELGSDVFKRKVDTPYMVRDAGAFFKRYGRVQGFTAIGYIMDQNDNKISIYYQSLCENGMPYHKIVVVGNTRDGYRVESALAQDAPYKEYKRLTKFRNQ